MFGYVKVNKPELKIKDYEQYKAVYCSLCRELGRSFGIVPRMTLSYDFTFLALLRLAISEECPAFERKRCAFNPMKKCHYCSNRREVFRYTSAASVIMIYYKLRDNLHDAGFFKKAGAGLMTPLFARAHKKAKKLYPELEKFVSDMITSQFEVESKADISVDISAEPTARALGNIASFGIENDEKRIITERLGYCLGRWVYLLDAADDLEQDLKTGDFNPFRSLVKGEDTSSVYEEAEAVLTRTLTELSRTYDLLEVNRFKPILDNILYEGLYVTQRRILESKEVAKNE